MYFAEINWLAVFLCGVANLVVGFIWYGLLFNKAWVSLVNKSDEELAAMEKSAPKSYIISIFTTMLMAFVLANVLIAVKADSMGKGLLWGFLVWLGFEAMTRIENVLFEKRPFKLYLINTSFNLVLILCMTVILVLL